MLDLQATHTFLDTTRNGQGALKVGSGQDAGELLAAIAGDKVARTLCRAADRTRHPAQAFVARLVAN